MPGSSQEGALAAYLWEEISDEPPYRDPPGRFHRACRYHPGLCSVGLGAIENDVQGLRRSSGRLPDGGRGREHRQEARSRYQRPASVQMFAAMQLGGEKEAIEQAQIGAIQFARVSVGALGPVIDDLNVFNLPFLFRNTAHMQKVIDGPIGQELLGKVTSNQKAGLVGICWMDAGARSV